MNMQLLKFFFIGLVTVLAIILAAALIGVIVYAIGQFIAVAIMLLAAICCITLAGYHVMMKDCPRCRNGHSYIHLKKGCPRCDGAGYVSRKDVKKA